MTTDAVENSPLRGYEVVGIFALSLALSLLVCREYLPRDFIGDDREHLQYCGDVANGRLTLAQFLVTPHNEHLLPMWKLAYYAQWRWFGLAPIGWHVWNLVGHALGATALFVLVLDATGERLGAGMAAGLWATTSIGYSDNPLLWVAASHLSWGVAWWLLATAAAVRYARQPTLSWLVAMTAYLTLCLGTMGTLWILAPVVAIPLLSPTSELSSRSRTLGLAGWAIPTLILGAWQMQVVLTSSHAQTSTTHVEAWTFALVGVRTMAQMLMALSSLTFRSISRLPQETLAQSGLLAIVMLGYLLFAGWNKARWAWLILAAATGYTAIVTFARRDVPLEQALTWGRYLYLPMLAWCAVAACVVATVTRTFPQHRRWIALGCGIYLAATLWHQSRVAHAAVVEYEGRVAETLAYTQTYDLLLHELSRYAQDHDQVLRLWEMPVVDFPVVTELSRYRDYHYPAGLPGIEIVDGRELTELDLNQVTDACQHIEQPELADALDYWRNSADVIRLLRRLSAASEATGKPIRLPDLEAVRTSEYLQVPLSWFAPNVFRGGVPGITVAAADSFALADAQAALAALRHEYQPPGPTWREALEQWVDRLRSGTDSKSSGP